MHETTMKTQFRNFMIDIETTGLVPHRHAITSIAVVGFDWGYNDLLPPEILLHARITIPTGKVWSQDTMRFRREANIDIMERDIAEEITPDVLVRRLHHLIPHNGIVWANPSLFDIAFLEVYCHDYGFVITPPWHYRNRRDVRSWIEGLQLGDEEIPRPDKNEYKAHDAAQDCLAQIEWMQTALKLFRNKYQRPTVY